ncbi:MAG: hypothetical protein ACYC0T_06270 [Ramlibacter sp.]
MKFLVATLPCALLIAAAPMSAGAQAANGKQAATAATKPAPKKASRKKVKPANGVKAIEEAVEVDDDPHVELAADELEIAKKVHVGDIPCELGATVHITPHKKRAGFFIVRAGIQRFRMQPVASRTGAIRLEDPRAGAMWLQLGNKSMLMSQKMGRRLADDCKAPDQAVLDAHLKKNPLPSLLEPLPAAKADAPADPAVTPAVAPTAAAPAADAAK